jgi:16S rRNA (uracil1498-N3)-methyltransferase
VFLVKPLPRFYVPRALQQSQHLTLSEASSRHAQVLRLQPGDPLVLFNGQGGQWQANITEMSRKTVSVLVGHHDAGDTTELRTHITLAVVTPANDRMDFVIEKATELGASTIQPLMSERSVLRLSVERAEKKQAHWQAVAISASEQSGRTQVPQVLPVMPLLGWLTEISSPAPTTQRVLLSTTKAPALAGLAMPDTTHFVSLSGPEGGFSNAETHAAQNAGFVPVSLGPRVLRADTAPLAILAWWALGEKS